MAATGSTVGRVTLPIMFCQLLPPICFRWTNRVFGLLVLGQHTQPRDRLSPTRPLVVISRSLRGRMVHLLTSLSGRPYFSLCMGVFFMFLGYSVPFFYIVPFASQSFSTTPSYASSLLSFLNAGSFFGHVLPACLDQMVGSAVVLFAGAASLSIMVFSWLSIHNIPGITV